MPAWIVCLVFAFAAGTWVYTRLARSTGNADPKKSLMGATLAGAGIFVMLMILIKFVFNW